MIQRDSTVSEPMATHGIRLHHDPCGRLVMVDADGQEHVGVEPVRLFPLSDQDHWIALCDASGHEICCLEQLDHLATDTREALQEALLVREFLPVIQRIVEASSLSNPSRWEVETDRGPVVFELDDEDDVHRLGPGGAVIIDSHGIRYLIPDTQQLDPSSRRILDRYL